MIFFPYEWQNEDEWAVKNKFKQGDLVNIYRDGIYKRVSGLGVVVDDTVRGGHESLFPYMKVYVFREFRVLDIHVGALRIISKAP
jgi:hypothetical protein